MGVRSVLLHLAIASSLVASTSDARADDVLDEVRIPLHVEVEGHVRVEQGSDFRTSCVAPCSLHVPPGTLRVTMPSQTTDIQVDRESVLRQSAPNPGVRSGAAVAFIGGLVIVAAAVAVPLIVCTQRTDTIDSRGQARRSASLCDGISDSVKIAWIAGGGVGLTAAIAGGIVFALAGPRTQVIPTARSPSSSVSVIPSLVAGATATRERIVPGLSLSLAF